MLRMHRAGTYVYAANNPIRYTDPSGASHVDKDGWTVGDFNGELINNGTLYWNANDQVRLPRRYR